MPKRTNKEELWIQCQGSYDKLQILLNMYSNETLEQGVFEQAALYKNVRDVLAHLHHWHLLLLGWYAVGMQGQKPAMPAEGYTWRTVPALNQVIWELYKKEALTVVKQLLETSHHQVLELIQKHSDTELFEKKYYQWTGSTSLGAYLISSTVSHYKWAHKKIKKTLPKSRA
ncbi:MAG: ClbS/DfsB family four-helix bundle protein [Aureispira sp.]